MPLSDTFVLNHIRKSHEGISCIALDWDDTRNDKRSPLDPKPSNIPDSYAQTFCSPSGNDNSDWDTYTQTSTYVSNRAQWNLVIEVLALAGISCIEGSQRLFMRWDQTGYKEYYDAMCAAISHYFPNTGLGETIPLIQMAVEKPFGAHVQAKVDAIKKNIQEALRFLEPFKETEKSAYEETCSKKVKEEKMKSLCERNFFLIDAAEKIAQGKITPKDKCEEYEGYQVGAPGFPKLSDIALLCNVDKGLLLAAICDAKGIKPEALALYDDSPNYKDPTEAEKSVFIQAPEDGISYVVEQDNGALIERLLLKFIYPEAVYAFIEISTAPEAIKNQFYQHPFLIGALKKSRLYTEMGKQSQEVFNEDLKKVARNSPALAEALLDIYVEEKKLSLAKKEALQKNIHEEKERSRGAFLAKVNRELVAQKMLLPERQKYLAMVREALEGRPYDVDIDLRSQALQARNTDSFAELRQQLVLPQLKADFTFLRSRVWADLENTDSNISEEEVTEYHEFGAHTIRKKSQEEFSSEHIRKASLEVFRDAKLNKLTLTEASHASLVLESLEKPTLDTEALVTHLTKGPLEILERFTERLVSQPYLVGVPTHDHRAPLSGAQVVQLVQAISNVDIRAQRAADVLQLSVESNTQFTDIFSAANKGRRWDTFKNWVKGSLVGRFFSGKPDYENVLNGRDIVALILQNPSFATEILSVAKYRQALLTADLTSQELKIIMLQAPLLFVEKIVWAVDTRRQTLLTETWTSQELMALVSRPNASSFAQYIVLHGDNRNVLLNDKRLSGKDVLLLLLTFSGTGFFPIQLLKVDEHLQALKALDMQAANSVGCSEKNFQAIQDCFKASTATEDALITELISLYGSLSFGDNIEIATIFFDQKLKCQNLTDKDALNLSNKILKKWLAGDYQDQALTMAARVFLQLRKFAYSKQFNQPMEAVPLQQDLIVAILREGHDAAEKQAEKNFVALESNACAASPLTPFLGALSALDRLSQNLLLIVQDLTKPDITNENIALYLESIAGYFSSPFSPADEIFVKDIARRYQLTSVISVENLEALAKRLRVDTFVQSISIPMNKVLEGFNCLCWAVNQDPQMLNDPQQTWEQEVQQLIADLNEALTNLRASMPSMPAKDLQGRQENLFGAQYKSYSSFDALEKEVKDLREQVDAETQQQVIRAMGAEQAKRIGADAPQSKVTDAAAGITNAPDSAAVAGQTPGLKVKS